MGLDNSIRCHGTVEETEKLVLQAGCLSMIYDRGCIRHVSVQHNEIVRMIYFAVRDKDWITIGPEISDEKFDIHKTSFIIDLKCRFRSGDSLFRASINIKGRNDSTISYSFKGTAQTSFSKNRIGLCVLHPIEGCSGKTCLITHSNAPVQLTSFPLRIMPYQPFTDLKSIQWEENKYKIGLSFHGDIFETEDQRNWTDASFKTYSTPLSLPFPVILQPDEQINQTVEFKLSGGISKTINKYTECRIDLDFNRVHIIPAIGISKSTRTSGMTRSEIRILNKLQFDHYRADLYLFEANWKKKMEEAIREAKDMNIPIVFGLFFSDDYIAESADFVKLFPGKETRPNALIIFHKNKKATSDVLLEALAPGFRLAFPDTKIGYGTNANFAELNRNRPVTDQFDFLSYSIHPQEHASDNLTLIENLGAQKDTVETARCFAKNKGIWISPVTIKRRFNANTENYEQPHNKNEYPTQVDSRLMSLFGAFWTVGSLKYLIQSDIESLTFFETTGERGIIQGEFNSQWPELFPSVKGMIFPVYFILKFVLKNKGYRVISSKSSNPLIIDSLILTDGEILKIILANFTSDFRKAIVSGCRGDFTMIQLDSKSYHFAVSNPNWLENSRKKTLPSDQSLPLEPYSVSFVESKLIK